MLAVTAGGLLLVTWIATKAVLFFLQEAGSFHNRLAKACPCIERLSWECSTTRPSSWRRSPPEDNSRNEVLGARVNLYMAAEEMGYGRSGRQPPGKG